MLERFEGRWAADGPEDDEDRVRVERAAGEGPAARLRVLGRRANEGRVLEDSATLGNFGSVGRDGQRLATVKYHHKSISI
jgi:hypothetical protein